MIRIDETPFEPEAELAAFRRAAKGAGAIASFVGCVREDDGAHALILEHYPALTEPSIRRHAEQARERFSLQHLHIVHRVGAMAPGEPIVLVACASAHRKDALEAVDFLMDHLKSEAPFWKRESRDDGDRWIEPSSQDRESAAHWREPTTKGAMNEP